MGFLKLRVEFEGQLGHFCLNHDKRQIRVRHACLGWVENSVGLLSLYTTKFPKCQVG